jgi:hypothetical protein
MPRTSATLTGAKSRKAPMAPRRQSRTTQACHYFERSTRWAEVKPKVLEQPTDERKRFNAA